MTNFSLIPFDSDLALAIAIDGKIERDRQAYPKGNRDLLRIEYKLKGVSQVVITKQSDPPTRQYDLWEHTCFEFFLALKDSTIYWEFNLSPAKHWNVFRFLNYRQDIAEEMSFGTLPFEVLLQDDSLLLNLEVELDKIISSESELEVGITTVVKDEQQLSYWALTHPAKEPDFHHPDSFIIKL